MILIEKIQKYRSYHNTIYKSRRYLQFFFFFQAEDGIRDYKVTGVQTCALPICRRMPLFSVDSRARAAPARREQRHPPARVEAAVPARAEGRARPPPRRGVNEQIGRASCRERV